MRWQPTKRAADATPFASKADATQFAATHRIPTKWPGWAICHADGGLIYIALQKGGPWLTIT